MQIDEVLGSWLRSQFPPVTGTAKKYLAITAVLLFLLLFGDSVLPWLGHGAHLLIETVELALEHLLEKAFDLSPRGAQVVIAWTAMTGIIYVSVRLTLRLHRFCATACAGLLERLAAMRDLLRKGEFPSFWVKSAVTLFVFGFTLYLFS